MVVIFGEIRLYFDIDIFDLTEAFQIQIKACYYGAK